MSRYAIWVFLALMRLAFPDNAMAAPSLAQDFQLWMQGALSAELPPRRLSFNADVNVRRGGGARLPIPGAEGIRVPSPHTQIVIRPLLRYALPHGLSVGAGYVYYPILYDDALHRPSRNFHEHRAFSELTLGRALRRKIAFTGRMRLEHRFRSSGPGAISEAAERSPVAHRLRLFLRAERLLKEASGLHLVTFSESFFHLNASAFTRGADFDQQRSFLGLAIDMGRRGRAEGGYLNQFIKTPSTQNWMNHAIFLILSVAVSHHREAESE